MSDFIYDLETYPNCFTMAVEHADAPFKWLYEISEFKDDTQAIIEFVNWLTDSDSRMVGFNNLGFDYPVLHLLLLHKKKCTYKTLYSKAQSVINSQSNPNTRFNHLVYNSDMYVPQIDLYKIHHFDNMARLTSLKTLEFNMRMDNIEDLPFPVGQELTREQIEVLKEYNQHDVTATKKFYHETLDMIRFREELTDKYNKNFMNHNDTKIGKDYFAMKLEQSGVQIHDYGPDGRKPKQTIRDSIALKDAILPSISFERLEFQHTLDILKSKVITETKGVFNNLNCTIDGFKYVFGLGGIHGSVDSQVVEDGDGYIIEDWDVASYYPNLAIANNFYPEHLSERFCEIYKDLYEQRKQHKKGTAEKAMLKLALNGVYGDSNSKFSVFYDPLFTMSITLNGQLLLCKLAEMLIENVIDLQMIQINTDGLTIKYHHMDKDHVHSICERWERDTQLSLEVAQYSQMAIRDVNNYIAVYTNGDVKRKGAYDYNLSWHQNASSLVVPKVAEQILLEGGSVYEAVKNHNDVMDFMIRAKVPRSSRLSLVVDGVDEDVQNTSRYYVSNEGHELIKRMPPTKKQSEEGKTDWRRFNQQKGYVVTICNEMPDTFNINHQYYVNEVEKLIFGF